MTPDPTRIDGTEVGRRLDQVRDRIAEAGGDPERVRIVAVTKGFGPDAVRSAMAVGVVDIAESYAQELLPKVRDLQGAPLGAGEVVWSPTWHFIGRLQSNKVRLLAPVISVWQSIDRAKLVAEVARWAPGAQVLIEVNVAGEAGKGGCPPADVGALVSRARDYGLDVTGLMTVAPRGADQVVRSAFRLLTSLADAQGLGERSMGMSGDYGIAVQEGATTIRLGAALFGPRTDPRKAHQEMRN
ncbi:MAG: YggS family pyridoxal phosphate-dependent enzyme [Actinobacteria bacterium]|nr:YggS family pyridoxal phosphate-dependent enzyme [Actinomycetota bacterium]